MDKSSSKLEATFRFSDDGQNIEDVVLSAPSEEAEKVLRGIVDRFIESQKDLLQMKELTNCIEEQLQGKEIVLPEGVERIPYESDRFDPDRPCPACGVEPGEYHEDLCDLERCPICHQGQFISCGCAS